MRVKACFKRRCWAIRFETCVSEALVWPPRAGCTHVLSWRTHHARTLLVTRCCVQSCMKSPHGLQAFEAWFKMLQSSDAHFRRIYDKKLSCMGLVSIVALPPDALPPALVTSLPLVRSSDSCSHEM